MAKNTGKGSRASTDPANSGYRATYICSPRKAGKLAKADQKAIRNFQEFLRGKGKRCPLCLHKAKRHALSGCGVKACDCSQTVGFVLEWWRAKG